ncbi:MAG TPA: hypothetical protein VJP07_04000 [Dehalococcoidia bacterium]|nr:hypothetical protein [Dehalococcoidia bacterium]
MRRLNYRHAITAFVFTACWLVLGFLFLISPIPDLLGITGELIQAWIVLSFVATGLSGAMLTMAAVNGIFPPVLRPPAQRPPGRSARGAPDAAGQSWQRPLPSRTHDT